MNSLENIDLKSLPELISQSELAKYLNKSEAWCERARWLGIGPPFVKLGRSVRYRLSDIEEYIEANLIATTQERQR